MIMVTVNLQRIRLRRSFQNCWVRWPCWHTPWPCGAPLVLHCWVWPFPRTCTLCRGRSVARGEFWRTISIALYVVFFILSDAFVKAFATTSSQSIRFGIRQVPYSILLTKAQTNCNTTSAFFLFFESQSSTSSFSSHRGLIDSHLGRLNQAQNRAYARRRLEQWRDRQLLFIVEKSATFQNKVEPLKLSSDIVHYCRRNCKRCSDHTIIMAASYPFSIVSQRNLSAMIVLPT